MSNLIYDGTRMCGQGNCSCGCPQIALEDGKVIVTDTEAPGQAVPIKVGAFLRMAKDPELIAKLEAAAGATTA